MPPDAGAGGLPSPPTWLPDDADPAALPYPVLVKPRGLRAPPTAAPIRRSSRSSCATRRSESVIQRALPGAEFSIDCLGDLDGRPLGAVPAG